ncbi:uncharacterized protein LOC131248286 isoform X3 [Magnolia sinica]|uniref:uncharacterized protein LOC131248286 isoform X3 n=1 Tax=Magnolia sinica TaxID=86752 RepID=UPI00265B3B6F|nr:uncharacterized protein LOC131248286 isoform X3 [Magnolia sinica]
MDSNQLMDSLTAHIALYHSSISPSSSNLSNPRNSILRWFSSLSIPHRQSTLSITDRDFLLLLLQMRSHLRSRGHGLFLVLPDLPSSRFPSLPSLCYRRSRGLLSRSSASNLLEHSLSRSVLVFSSKEGEPVRPIQPLDSITVSEDFVSDLDRFVNVMDGVSDGGFLRGDEGGALGSTWQELPWLKAKGYYSLEAFVANRLELALRLSWLNCCTGKKRGVKVKEKAGAAGVAANLFWRKKGCLDWWDGLDPGIRKKIFRMVLGKRAKCLANEVIKGANDALKDEMGFLNVGAEQPLRYGPTPSCQSSMKALSGTDADVCLGIIPASISGKPTSLSNAVNGLLVLQEMSAMILAYQHGEIEKEKLFFSTLGSVHTVSDFLFRRLRGFLMVLSSDYIKRELLGDDDLKAPMNKSKEKSGGGSRKGKNKGRNTKKLHPVQKSSRPDIALQKHSEEHGCVSASRVDNNSRLGYLQNATSVEANGKPVTVNGCILQRELCKETSLSSIKEVRPKGSVNGKVQTTEKKSRKESNINKKSSLEETVKIGYPEENITENISSSVIIQSEPAAPSGLVDPSAVHHLSNDYSISGELCSPPNSSLCNATCEPTMEDGSEVSKNIQEHSVIAAAAGSFRFHSECSQTRNTLESGDLLKPDLLDPGKGEGLLLKDSSKSSSSSQNNSMHDDRKVCSCITSSNGDASGGTSDLKSLSTSPAKEHDIIPTDEGLKHQNSGCLNESASQPAVFPKSDEAALPNDENAPLQKEGGDCYVHEQTSSFGGMSYEWPSLAPFYFPSSNSQHLPPATDRLHLDVGQNWCNHAYQSFVSTRHCARNVSLEGGRTRIMPSRTLPMSLDWPPMVRSASRLVPSVTCSYDSGLVPRLQSPFHAGFTAHGVHLNGMKDEDERKYSGDVMDFCDLKNADLTDDSDSHWVAEEEYEVHAFSGRDYNQFFGGGVMYWNTSDHAGTGFSRPPSLSSEDSSWAWREADLNRAIDDMVGLPASYSSNGLASSPPAGPFCSPFDPLVPGHQPLGGYVMPGSDATGKVLHSSSTVADLPEEKVSGSLTSSPAGVVEGMTGDTLPYPILRPIIVPGLSRERSRSEFKVNHDRKSPCVPHTRRETPRIKRPPSPVVLCVPRAPRPPPPSPVGESRKQRGFPTVRSGSSSPRQLGMRSWYHEGISCDEARLCVDGAEVVWPSWGNKSLAANSMIKPLPGALLQDHLIAISQLALDQEHPDVALPLQPPDLLNCPTRKMSLSVMHSLLHEEIDSFCKQVAAGNLIKKPYINWAVKRVARSLQVLWPRSRTNIFGSNATGLALPTSDVDLVVCLPPVRNLEPIKEAGILEGRNGIKETCLQHAARYLANQEWVKSDSLKTIENTAIPVIMLVAEVPHDVIASRESISISHTSEVESAPMTGEQGSVNHSDMSGSENSLLPLCSKMENDDSMDMKSVRLDISFKSPSHTGLQTTELVRELTEQFPAAVPLALVLKQFLADRSLDHSYSGGLSSYCLVLLITRFLQHEHHLGRHINQNLGSLLMDFLYFFGIDPIHIDDPLYPTNNVGRNCFRIHQCIKAFADAYSVLENELTGLPGSGDPTTMPLVRLLPKIIPSIDSV